MASTNETRRMGGAKSEDCSLLRSESSSGPNVPSPTNQADVAATKRHLIRELQVEPLGFARRYAELGQTFTNPGDDQGAPYVLRNLCASMIAVCQCGADIRSHLDAEQARKLWAEIRVRLAEVVDE